MGKKKIIIRYIKNKNMPKVLARYRKKYGYVGKPTHYGTETIKGIRYGFLVGEK